MASMHVLTRASAALAITASLFLPASARAQGASSPGDVAIIGWIDNGTPADVFTVVTLADLPSGAQVYFTDNGWDAAAGAFRNTNGVNDGDGNEQLIRLDALVTIPAGTILSTTDVDPRFQWATSGAIPGATSGSFGSLVLAQTGDQICAFRHDTGSNPLNTATQTHLFVLDDTGVFENATSTATGNVPPGLSNAAGTAVTFAQLSSSQNFMAFHTNALPAGTKSQWLAAIRDPANWTFGSAGTLPSGTIQVANGQVTAYCFGDGSLATACPCGNSGVAGHGCDNSFATGGALLFATGSVSPDTLTLTSTSQVPITFDILLQGDASNPNGVVFGDGLRCAAGVLRKLVMRPATGGAFTYPQVGDPSLTATATAHGDVISPGSVRNYQVYYRDALISFCDAAQGGGSFNVSNALQVVW